MTKKLGILTILLFWTGLLFAQNPNFQVAVAKNEVAVGEQFEIQFSLNINGDRFTPPNFTGFQVLSGPNISQSMTSVNGNTSMSIAYGYILAADKEGDYTISSATIYVNGRLFATHPVKMHVVKPSPQQQQQARRAQQQQQAQRQAQQADQVTTGDISNNLFIKAVPDKTNVYVGEQINLNYKLYTKVPILDNSIDKLPELNGFWSQDANEGKPPRQVQWHTEVLNGSRYNVAEIKSTILLPQRAGNLTIDPYGMTFTVRQQAPARDVMEQFFGAYKDVRAKVKSAAVTIHVKPLPEAGKPADFTGAVGTFSVSASLDKSALKANETINYNVRVKGTGNIMLIQNPKPDFPTDFEKYDPKVTDTISKENGRIAGSRFYNFLLIPRHQGDYTLEPLKFTYFNPASQKYVTVETKPFKVAVAKGKNETNVSTLAAGDKEDVKVLDKDIRYIKQTKLGFGLNEVQFFGSMLYWIMILLGPLAFIIAYYYRRWYMKVNSDVVRVRSRKASKLAARHLANAKLQLSMQNMTAFYEAIFRGLYGYLADKLNIPYGNLDKEVITEALRSKSVSETVITQLEDTLDLCDMARFAPVTGISGQEVYDKAANLINDIEDEI